MVNDKKIDEPITSEPDSGSSSGTLSDPIEVEGETSEPLNNRESADLKKLLLRASHVWSRDIGVWALTASICFIVGAALFLINTHKFGWALTWILNMINALIVGVIAMGLYAMAIRAVHGHTPSINQLGSQIHKAFKYFVQYIIVVAGYFILFGVTLGLLALISGVAFGTPITQLSLSNWISVSVVIIVSIPVWIYFILGVAFTSAELAYNDEAGPIEALVTSWRIASGNRWLMCKVGAVAVALGSGSFLLLVVGGLFGVPFGWVLWTTLYLTLRDGADVTVVDKTPDARSQLETPVALGACFSGC